ncbi:hypothetical protein HY213_05000 [Candidatus Peregrinibacteria bacterium]|nr:hypothetical protein [Candidatus Peregrinibacteria bacterium]
MAVNRLPSSEECSPAALAVSWTWNEHRGFATHTQECDPQGPLLHLQYLARQIIIRIMHVLKLEAPMKPGEGSLEKSLVHELGRIVGDKTYGLVDFSGVRMGEITYAVAIVLANTSMHDLEVAQGGGSLPLFQTIHS